MGVTESPALIARRPTRTGDGYSKRTSTDGVTSPPPRAVARAGALVVCQLVLLLVPPPPCLPPAYAHAPAAERPPGHAARAQSPPSTPPSGRYTPHSAT